MRIQATSDTHNRHEELDTSNMRADDLFIHAGDFTNIGRPEAVAAFADWLDSLPMPRERKIVVPGNHDLSMDPWGVNEDPYLSEYDQAKARLRRSAIVLVDSAQVIGDIRIYGTPFTPLRDGEGGWAFQKTEAEQAASWGACSHVDIFVAHCPPWRVLDVDTNGQGQNRHWGSTAIKDVILQTKPKIMICGHIHGSYSGDRPEMLGDTRVYNVASNFAKNDIVGIEL